MTKEETTEELAGAFVNDPVFGDFTWVRPVGRQEDLLWAARPGGRFSSSLRAYRQLTHASAFAASIPVVEYRLGRTTGIPLAVVTGSPLQSLAYLDLHADTQDQKGNTVAFIGKMGAGKTEYRSALFPRRQFTLAGWTVCWLRRPT